MSYSSNIFKCIFILWIFNCKGQQLERGSIEGTLEEAKVFRERTCCPSVKNAFVENKSGREEREGAAGTAGIVTQVETNFMHDFLHIPAIFPLTASTPA